MSVQVSLNGTTYEIPVAREVYWASGDTGLTAYLEELGTFVELITGLPVYIELKYVKPTVQAITASGAATAIDASAGYDIELDLATATTAITWSNLVDGVRYFVRVKQDVTGGRDISDWAVGETVKWPADTAPNISGMTSNQVMHVCFKYEDSKLRGEYSQVYSS